MNLSRWPYLVGCVLLLALAYYALIHQEKPNSNAADSKNQPIHRNVSEDTPAPRPNRRLSRKQTSAASPTHTYAELKNFIIPELKLENSTFKQALYDLRDHYYQICQLIGEKPILLKFKIQGNALSPHTITLRNQSLLKALDTLAALGGMELTREGNLITYTSIPPTEGTSSVELRVRPDLDKALGIESTSSLAAKLKEIAHANHCNIRFNPNKSTIQLSGNTNEIERIQSLIEIYQNTPLTQIRMMTKIITMHEKNLTRQS